MSDISGGMALAINHRLEYDRACSASLPTMPGIRPHGFNVKGFNGLRHTTAAGAALVNVLFGRLALGQEFIQFVACCAQGPHKFFGLRPRRMDTLPPGRQMRAFTS